MKDLSEHQIKLWKSMITLIDEYIEKKVEFGYLVNSLEGLLDAGEIKNEELVKHWYEHWVPLEIINSETEAVVSDQQKIEAAMKMKEYLEKVSAS